MRVLLVENRSSPAQGLASVLRQRRMAVDVAGSLRAAEYAALDVQYDLILLERVLPDGDGIALLDLLRQIGSHSPVLMLCANGGIADRFAGLDRGADDCLARPFAIDELLARMRAVVRRPGLRRLRRLHLGRLSFDTDLRCAFVNDVAVRLARRELLVLEVLLQYRLAIVPRSTLLTRVYEGNCEPTSNALDSHLSRLRVKLDGAGAGVKIQAVRGIGYVAHEKL